MSMLTPFYGIHVKTSYICYFFFFQAEAGIRVVAVTGVQTCALPIHTIDSRGMAAIVARAVDCITNDPLMCSRKRNCNDTSGTSLMMIEPPTPTRRENSTASMTPPWIVWIMCELELHSANYASVMTRMVSRVILLKHVLQICCSTCVANILFNMCCKYEKTQHASTT